MFGWIAYNGQGFFFLRVSEKTNQSRMFFAEVSRQGTLRSTMLHNYFGVYFLNAFKMLLWFMREPPG
jgi:hypothetical protein